MQLSVLHTVIMTCHTALTQFILEPLLFFFSIANKTVQGPGSDH